MRSEQEANRAIDRYGDTVFRLCMLHFKNRADAEDIFQSVFLKYVLHSVPFESEQHERAWMIRVTLNACKDLVKNVFRRAAVPLDEWMEQPQESSQGTGEVLEAVRSLPRKYRDMVYLHYYEGYTAAEIAKILRKNVNTVYTLLTRSRQLLKEELEGGDADE